MLMETGRRGGRASEKAGARDIAMDETVSGGYEDTYRPKATPTGPKGEHGWQGHASDEDDWSGPAKEEIREGFEKAKRVQGKDQHRLAYGGHNDDSLGGQLMELEDKLKSGMITKKEYDRLIVKLENPDAVINYEPSGYEKSGTETRETIAGHDEQQWDDHDIEEEIDRESAYDEEESEEEVAEKRERGGHEEELMQDDYNMVSRGLDRQGRRGGRASDRAGSRDDNSLETKKQELKEMLQHGLITPQEHDRQLREIMPSINFKSAGATRQRAKDEGGRRGGRSSDKAGGRDMRDPMVEAAQEEADMATDPPVSQAQRRAMGAAMSGKSNLGIPKSVGKEFIETDPGGSLPARKK
jgi:hypothetical protein